MSTADGSSTSSSITSAAAAVVITSFPLNPLTTTFTPPADCKGFYEKGVFMLDPETSCLPSNAPLKSTAFFSPGIACPSGYVSACHDTRGVASITTVTCCPVHSDITLSCAGHSLSDLWSTLFCTWIAPSSTVIDITASSNGITSTSAATLVSPGGLNAYGVRMVYESTDLPSSTSSKASSQSTNSGKATSSSSTSPTSSPTSTPSGISSGAKIAIGVVIPVLVLAILGAVFLWWRRRHQYGAVRNGSPASAAELHDQFKTSELPVEAKGSNFPGQVKMDSREPQELHNDGMPVELPVDHER